MVDVSGIPNLGFGGGAILGGIPNQAGAMSAQDIQNSIWGRYSPQQAQATFNQISGPLNQDPARYAAQGAAFGRATGGFGGAPGRLGTISNPIGRGVPLPQARPPMYSGGGIGSDMRYGGQNNFMPGGIPTGAVTRGPRLAPAAPGDPYFMVSDAAGFNPNPMGRGGIGSDMRFGGQNKFSRSPQLDSAIDAVTPDAAGRFGGFGSSPFRMPQFNDPRASISAAIMARGGDSGGGRGVPLPQPRPLMAPQGSSGGIGSDMRYGGQNRLLPPFMGPEPDLSRLPNSGLFERYRASQPTPMGSENRTQPFAGGDRFSPWTAPAAAARTPGPPRPSMWQTDPWMGGGFGMPGSTLDGGRNTAGGWPPALVGAARDAYGNPAFNRVAPPFVLGGGTFGGGTGIGGLGQGTAFRPIPNFRR